MRGALVCQSTSIFTRCTSAVLIGGCFLERLMPLFRGAAEREHQATGTSRGLRTGTKRQKKKKSRHPVGFCSYNGRAGTRQVDGRAASALGLRLNLGRNRRISKCASNPGWFGSFCWNKSKDDPVFFFVFFFFPRAIFIRSSSKQTFKNMLAEKGKKK